MGKRYLLIYGASSLTTTVVGWLIGDRLTGGEDGLVPLLSGMGGFAAGLLVVSLLLRAFGSGQPERQNQESLPATSVANTSPSAIRKHHGHTIITHTPNELIAELSGKTSLDAKEISRRYQGFALETDGVMADIDERYDGVIVLLRRYLPDRSDDVFIHLHFDKKLLPELRACLKVGARVRAVGVVDSIDTFGLSLRDCELQSVDLPQPTYYNSDHRAYTL